MDSSQTKSSGRPLWLWPNLLSLDAPLIAVLWLNLFASSGRIRLAPAVPLVLALVVWLIYVADRLLDSLRSDQADLRSARHRFYRAHRSAFFALLVGLLGVTGWACLTLDPRTLRYGVLMMMVVAGYFAAVHSLQSKARIRFPKEAAVGVLFGLGTYFPAWVHLHKANPGMDVSVVLFVLLCWLNAALIEYSEWLRLRRGRWQTPHASTVTVGRHLLGIGIVVALAALWMTFPAAFHVDLPLLWAIALSAVALAGLGLWWRHLAIDTVRVLADATLLTPGLVLLFLHR